MSGTCDFPAALKPISHASVAAFAVPGEALRQQAQLGGVGDPLRIRTVSTKQNSARSLDLSHAPVVSCEYVFDSFDFCQESSGSAPSENLGQVVFGERIRPSPYKVADDAGIDLLLVLTTSVHSADLLQQRQ